MPMESFQNISIYPLHIRMLNKVSKKITNTNWTILDLLAYTFPVLSTLIYQTNIKKEYDKEHHILNITDEDNILHIGCGIFPYSAILLSKKIQANITAIDNDKKVIKYAKKLIHNSNLDNKIKIETGEGSTYDLTSFSVIISSSCVDSTYAVLHNILKNSRPGTRIILRELQPMSHYLKEIIEHQDVLTLEKQYTTYSFPFYSFLGWDSFILKKNLK